MRASRAAGSDKEHLTKPANQRLDSRYFGKVAATVAGVECCSSDRNSMCLAITASRVTGTRARWRSGKKSVLGTSDDAVKER